MNPSEYTNADLQSALAVVKSDFDPIAARNLIEYFYACLENGHSFDNRILHEYVHHVFGLIVKGQKAEVALGLKRPRGRPKTIDPMRDFKLAASVFLHIRKAPDGIEDKWQYAIGETANRFFPDGTGDTAVRDAYARFKSVLGAFSDEELTEIVDYDNSG